MPRVYISIGSNVDRGANLRAAVAALQERFGEMQLSSVYESAAVGFAGDDFYNLVAAFDTEESVACVVRFLRQVEHARGRRRQGARFAPRALDMDLLLYGDLVVDDGDLRLPRPEINSYAFVLGPLAEIAGDLRHPLSGKRMSQLWAACTDDAAALRRVAFAWHRS